MNTRKRIKDTIYFLQQNPFSRFLYQQEIKKRSKLDLRNIHSLAKNINIFSSFTNEIHTPNDWYGHAKILKDFVDISQTYQLKFLMEHGVYLTDQVDDIDIETPLPSIVTYCEYRANVLKKYRRNVFSIGPFIHYAKSYLNEDETKKEKKRLGKTILLFPSHSNFHIGLKYDSKWLCQKVKLIGKNFDTVRVCLYWTDVILRKDEIYEDFGFECVTAGHMLDPLFLPRLRSMIETSDSTISNIGGTHVGYSILFNKPHIIIFQKPKLTANKHWQQRIKDFWKSGPFIEVLNEFSAHKFAITSKQRSLVEKYWGTKLIKTKKELKQIIDKTEIIYSEANKL